MLKKTISIALSAILVPIFFIGIANSQALERVGIEEIIVTAQKTEQNIQDVPIAVTAFDAGSLELQQIETFSDIQFNAPNITLQKVTLRDQTLLFVELTLILLLLPVIVVWLSILMKFQLQQEYSKPNIMI